MFIFNTVLLHGFEIKGVWTGKLDLVLPDGQKVTSHAYVNLWWKSGELTGSAGPSERKQTSIRSAKLEGMRITFEAGPQDDALRFDLVLLDGHLKSEATGKNGTRARVDLTRVAAAD